MKKEIASINLSLKRKLCQRNFSYEKWVLLVSVGLLVLVGNGVEETGTCARAAPCSDTQLYICRYVNRR